MSVLYFGQMHKLRPFQFNEIPAINEHFLTQGWLLLDLPNPDIVEAVRTQLQKKLKEVTQCPEACLENYHQIAQDDEKHSTWQIELTRYFRDSGFGPQIIEEQVDFFRNFLGPDLLVQESPYLRITRPGKEQDNIGFHRDTTYGGSPYEVSVWLPLVETGEENSISVYPGSNIQSESCFPVKQIKSKHVEKGSPLHSIGFLYSPQVLQIDVHDKMITVPARPGQAVIFSLSTLHGSVVNKSAQTRWSVDTRVLNKLAPVDLSKRPYKFHTFSMSAVTAQAEKYFQNQ